MVVKRKTLKDTFKKQSDAKVPLKWLIITGTVGLVLIGISIGTFFSLKNDNKIGGDELHWSINLNIIASMYFMVMVNFIGGALSCSLQRFLETQNIILQFGIVYIIMFFLVVCLDSDTIVETFWDVVARSFVVSFIFWASTRNSDRFTTLTIVTLIVDQMIRFYQKTESVATDKDLNLARTTLGFVYLTTVLIGVIYYFVREQHLYGETFSIIDFIRPFKSRCALIDSQYAVIGTRYASKPGIKYEELERRIIELERVLPLKSNSLNKFRV